jgi:hypothetical protein
VYYALRRVVLRSATSYPHSRASESLQLLAPPKSAQSLPSRGLLQFANYFGLRFVYFHPTEWVESRVVDGQEKCHEKTTDRCPARSASVLGPWL